MSNTVWAFATLLLSADPLLATIAEVAESEKIRTSQQDPKLIATVVMLQMVWCRAFLFSLSTGIESTL